MSFMQQMLGGDADPVLWHARGFQSIKARALDEGTAWRFYSAILGVDRLHLPASSRRQLHLRLVPRNSAPEEAQISIGRISVSRQGD